MAVNRSNQSIHSLYNITNSSPLILCGNVPSSAVPNLNFFRLQTPVARPYNKSEEGAPLNIRRGSANPRHY